MRGSSRGLAWTLVALAVLNGRESVAAPAERVSLELRLGARAGLDDNDIRLVEETAIALLATGGIDAEWQTCQPVTACPVKRGLVVLVQVLPLWKMADRDVCGEVVRDARTDLPIVLVYLNRNREVTLQMRSRSIGRWHPALATLEVGHLVGLTIAHEVGHALGLPHGTSGVMKAKPTVDDVIALRQSRLAFSAPERARMLAALLQTSASDVIAIGGKRQAGVRLFGRCPFAVLSELANFIGGKVCARSVAGLLG